MDREGLHQLRARVTDGRIRLRFFTRECGCFADEQTDYTNGVLEHPSGPVEAIAPRLWAFEIRTGVLMGVRRRRTTLDQAEDFLQSLGSLPIRLSDAVSYDAVFALAQKQGLAVYDAAYLDLAVREGIAIASLDRELLSAASQLSVPGFELPRK